MRSRRLDHDVSKSHLAVLQKALAHGRVPPKYAKLSVVSLLILSLFLICGVLSGIFQRDGSALIKLKSTANGRENQRLFYNRVPKCGSSTLVSLMERLAEKNGFQHKSSALLDSWGLFRESDQEQFAKAFVRQDQKVSYDRHLFFLDFTRYSDWSDCSEPCDLCYTTDRFGLPNPIYINLVRDPTERVISEFYFRRKGQKDAVKRGEKEWLEEDLEKCVKEGKDYDCRFITGTYTKNMIAFFCGHDISCSKHNDEDALKKAKWNVENFYEVVGVLEDIETSLKVLEKRIPQYFAGALEIYRQSEEHIVNRGQNRASKISEETRAAIRRNLTSEYEFYDFVKRRLKVQMEEI